MGVSDAIVAMPLAGKLDALRSRADQLIARRQPRALGPATGAASRQRKTGEAPSAPSSRR